MFLPLSTIPAYREANAGALRMGWPRIPLPGWPDGETVGAMEAVARSAEKGRELGQLLNSGTPAPGVTEAPLRPEIAAIAVPSTRDGSNMGGEDFAVTARMGTLRKRRCGNARPGTGCRAQLHAR